MYFQPRTLSQAKQWTFLYWINFIIFQFLVIYITNMLPHHPANTGRSFIHIANISPYTYIFSSLAIVSVIFGLYLHRKLPRAFFKKELKKAAERAHVIDPELNDELTTKATFIYSLIAICYCGSCGCYGLFLFLLEGNPVIVYPFALLSLLGLFVCRPRKSYYERIAQKVQEWKTQQNGGSITAY